MRAIIVLAYLAFLIAVVYGYINNIVSLVGMLGGDVTALFVARCIGFFAIPLGVVLGYI